MPIELSIPGDFINRDDEKDNFATLLKFDKDARLLAMEDKEGTGKSTLLKMLHHQCIWKFTNPVSVVQLDEPAINSRFVFIERLRKSFSRGEFKNFDALNQARVDKVSSRLVSSPASGLGAIDARGAVIGGVGHEFVGAKVRTTGMVVINAPKAAEWSFEQEENAKEECIKGFFDDLKALGDEKPIVILLDSYERCSFELKEWILNQFLLPLCFELETRPAKLMLVLAGRELPKFKDILGERYNQLVSSRRLGTWEDDHVKDFLRVHGYGDLKPDEVAFVVSKVKTGASIAAALNLANTIKLIR